MVPTEKIEKKKKNNSCYYAEKPKKKILNLWHLIRLFPTSLWQPSV